MGLLTKILSSGIIITGLIGCSLSDKHYDNLTGLSLYQYKEEISFKTIDEILQYYFTEQAYEILKDIPTEVPLWTPMTGMSANKNIFHYIALLAQGVIPGRKIVLHASARANAVIHEYLHQAEYRGLIKTEKVIEKYQEFKKEAIRKERKEEFEKVRNLEQQIEDYPWFYSYVHDLDSERVMILGEFLATDDPKYPLFPTYLHKPYKEILKSSKSICLRHK